MDTFLITSAVILSLSWIWLCMLALMAAKHDRTLDPFQRKAQMIIVLVIPFIGASIVLHLVNGHSPDVIPRKWIPWPLRNLIIGKERVRNSNRNDNDTDVSNYDGGNS